MDTETIAKLGIDIADTLGLPGIAPYLTIVLALATTIVSGWLCYFVFSWLLRNTTGLLQRLLELLRTSVTLIVVYSILLLNIDSVFPSTMLGWPAWSDKVIELTMALVFLLFILYYFRSLRSSIISIADDPKGLYVFGLKIERKHVFSSFFIIRAAIIIIFALMVLNSLGVNIKNILAVGGISGFIIGYAARDFLSNVFSGLRLSINRPFEVGDWIRCPSENIEGVVESIGWQDTCVRTFDKRPLYIPNSILALNVVENAAQMRGRRIYEVFGLSYDDIDKVEAVTDKVRELLDSHAGVNQNEHKLACFNRYGDSTLDCFFSCISTTIVWAEYQKVKEDLLLGVAKIVKEEGASFAFPTRTVIYENPPLASGTPPPLAHDLK